MSNHYCNVTYTSEQQTIPSPTNVIYIDDNPADNDLLHVKLANLLTSETAITLKGQTIQKASATNYHFTVVFGEGELASPENIAIASDQTGNWDIYVKNEVSGISIFSLHKGPDLTLKPGDSCTVTLRKVGATSANAMRSISPRVFFNKSDAYVSPGEMTFVPTTVEVMNLTRRPTPPLSVSFDTTNMVLCDGTATNTLVLRIQNHADFDIDLDQKQCSFTLYFDADPDKNQPWALATPNQVSAFNIPGKVNSSSMAGSWNIQQVHTPAEWKLTPTSSTTVLKARDAIEISISNIVTGHAVGRARLHVQSQGLHGYNDEHFTVEIQKTPLLYTNGRVGIGTTTPNYPLQVHTPKNSYGFSHTDGDVDLATYVGDSAAWLGTYSKHPLNFYTSRSQAQLTLTTEGKLGIGTTSPSAKLDVQGDTAISGKLGIGTTSPRAKLDVQGDVAITGGVSFSEGDGLKLNLGNGYGTAHEIGVQPWTIYYRANCHAFYKGGTYTNNGLFNPGDGGLVQMVIQDDKVGIGTTRPSCKLDVSGDAKIDGKLDVTRDVNTGGKLDVSGDVNIKGRFYFNGESPMKLITCGMYADTPTFDTDHSVNDWIACVIGFQGQGSSGHSDFGLMVMPEDRNGKWVIHCDVRGLEDKLWHVLVLLIRREFCGDFKTFTYGQENIAKGLTERGHEQSER